jgi:hypothetical protein
MVAYRDHIGDGDLLWIAIERLGATDAYAGDIRIHNIAILFKFASEGQTALNV